MAAKILIWHWNVIDSEKFQLTVKKVIFALFTVKWYFSLSSNIFHSQVIFLTVNLIFFTVKWNISLSSCDFFHCQLIFQWNQVKITNWWWCIPIIKIFHKFDCQISYVAYPMCQKCSRTCPFCYSWVLALQTFQESFLILLIFRIKLFIFMLI